MSTVDIDKLRYTITYEVDKELLCDQTTIDSDFNGSWQEWLDWFAENEMAEVMVGMDTEPLSIKVGDPTTTLKAELLAKMPKPTIGAPVDKYETGGECGAYADGYNKAITEITKILEEL